MKAVCTTLGCVLVAAAAALSVVLPVVPFVVGVWSDLGVVPDGLLRPFAVDISWSASGLWWFNGAS